MNDVSQFRIDIACSSKAALSPSSGKCAIHDLGMEVISMRTTLLRALGTHGCVCLFVGLVLAAGFGTHAWAQLTTARLDGTVLDPSGLAIAGATVTVQTE